MKHPIIEALINETAENIFGMSLEEAHTKGICVDCKKRVVEQGFRDEQSVREYMLSGLCGDCQDSVFRDE